MRPNKKWLIPLLAALAAFSIIAVGVAVWIVQDHDELGGNSFDTADAHVIDLDFTPTSVIWPAVVDGEPGASSYGEVRVNNNSVSENTNFAATVSNTNTTLAAGLTARVTSFPVGTDATCALTLNPDGTPTSLQVGEVDRYAAGTLDVVGTMFSAGGLIPFGSFREYCVSVVFPTPGDTALENMVNVTTFIFDSTYTP